MRYHVYARKLTWYFTGVCMKIINLKPSFRIPKPNNIFFRCRWGKGRGRGGRGGGLFSRVYELEFYRKDSWGRGAGIIFSAVLTLFRLIFEVLRYVGWTSNFCSCLKYQVSRVSIAGSGNGHFLKLHPVGNQLCVLKKCSRFFTIWMACIATLRPTRLSLLNLS